MRELAKGRGLDDEHIDGLLSEEARKASHRHWSPVPVAVRAAEMLTACRPCHVLDVGSGVGKFCILGALTTPANFIGVERRPWLVAEARSLARAIGIKRARFVLGGLTSVDWVLFDGVYLFNPFHENLDRDSRIDDAVDVGPRCFDEFILEVKIGLASLRDGARVVTYHGFGAEMPPGFERVAEEAWGDDYLDLWVKRFSPKFVPGSFGDPRLEFNGPCTD